MKAMLLSFGILLASPAYAKDDGRTIKRLMYADIWKRNLLSFFADNNLGQTSIKLVKSTLVITNTGCDMPEVKQALDEMFAPAVKVMNEIAMDVQCVGATQRVTIASR